MRIAAVAMLILLGGCGDTGKTAGASGASPAATSTSPASATHTNPRGEPAALALMADGLSLLPVGVFQPQVIGFGSPRAAVEKAAASAFPGIMPQRSRNGECGAGALDFSAYDTLTLNFQNGLLVGWFAKSPANIATIDGIRPGITRAELESERQVEMIADSTLDGEFRYFLPNQTEIGGFLDGAGSGAVVTALHSGTNCFFR
ncbi:MAG: hypothetical protein WA842_02330 [Croceibacterium sp.]